MEDKRPIKYVLRKIYVNDTCDENVIAGFVSKARLSTMGKWWNRDGSSSEDFCVDFCDDCFSWGKWVDANLSVETPDAEVECVFDDYFSCKIFVNEINRAYLDYLLSKTSDDAEYAKTLTNFKNALAFGKALEEKYIPAEERKTASHQLPVFDEFIND